MPCQKGLLVERLNQGQELEWLYNKYIMAQLLMRLSSKIFGLEPKESSNITTSRSLEVTV